MSAWKVTTLTMKDEKRLEIIHRVFRIELTVSQAALVLGLSARQWYPVKARVSKYFFAKFLGFLTDLPCVGDVKGRLAIFLSAVEQKFFSVPALIKCYLGLGPWFGLRTRVQVAAQPTSAKR